MQLASYEKIAQLNITKTFPGHFNAFENTYEVIERQVQKIRLRTEKCFALIQDGVRSAIDLANGIYPNRINNATPIYGDWFSGYFARRRTD